MHTKGSRRPVVPGWSASSCCLPRVDVGCSEVAEHPKQAIEPDVDAGRLDVVERVDPQPPEWRSGLKIDREQHRRAYLSPHAGSADVAAGGIPAAHGRDVDVVVVAPAAPLGVVGATPNHILIPNRVAFFSTKATISLPLCPLGGAGVGNHHVERQTIDFHLMRIRPNAADFANFGKPH